MKLIRNNRGIAIVYVTLFLMVLGILFFALGIDIGWMVYVKTQGQAATDASALAAASAIPNYNNTDGNKSKIDELAGLFNTDNTVMNQSAGIVSSDVTVCGGSPSNPECPWAVATTASGVKVTRTYNTPLFFTRLLNGAASTNLEVSSIAWLGGAAGLPPELPIAVCEDKIYQMVNGEPQCASPFTTKFSPNGGDTAAWWNKASVGQPSASECKGMVEGTIPIPFLSVGEIVDLNNGGLTSCLKDIEDKFKNCSAASCAGLEGQAKLDFCTVILPVVHCQNSISNNEPVKEFAAVCITEVESQGSDKIVNGTVQCNVTGPGSIGGGPQLGVYAERPVLVQ